MEEKDDLKAVYARLRECLNAVKPCDKELSGAMRTRLDYNISLLRCFIDLQGGNGSDVQAIGFEYEADDRAEENDE